jgi:bifunctional ADP-heptose synthase (sugar kinase/adenylyltransferase)
MTATKINLPTTPFKILLIGDSCVDEYVYGICSRLNPEAPVPVLDYSRTEFKAGMAANVYENLKTFKVNVEFVTNKEKIVKTRYIDGKYNHQILRVDKHETLSPLPDSISTKGYDAVVISDYNKGLITQERLFQIAETTECPIFIDSKKKIVPDKPNCFVKINEVEFGNLPNPPKNLITTLGDKGARYQDKIYATEKVTVFDVVGAGDTFLATLAYFYLLLGSIEKAIPYANKASSIVVQHTGTYVLTEQDLATIMVN